jgi:hypothetical protein
MFFKPLCRSQFPLSFSDLAGGLLQIFVTLLQSGIPGEGMGLYAIIFVSSQLGHETLPRYHF